MRFRNIFPFVFALFILVAGALLGPSAFRGSLFDSKEINRDDAKRQVTTLLSTDDWIEFQIVPGANNFRLLTNAALKCVDAPDFDLSNPRLGWKYAIEYELLDPNRKLIRSSNYHFRSEIRQLLDVDSGEVIYPIFFGKRSLASTQTRSMQMAVNRDDERAAILRVKLLSKDDQINEIVVRALARVERKDYMERKTWNRMSDIRRENIAKYCVYDHDLLTLKERNTLLRWRWSRCATLGEFEQRYLFFIGDIDDQEIREEQVPHGLYLDPQTLATIPVPEGKGTVRLDIVNLDASQTAEFLDVCWYGVGPENRTSSQHQIQPNDSAIEVPVEGGLLQIESSARVVARAFWVPLDDVAREIARHWEDHSQFLLDQTSNELEITPRPIMVRTFLADQIPVEYGVSHFKNQPTPMRVQIRYPVGMLFANDLISPAENLAAPPFSNNTEVASKSVTVAWHFLLSDGSIEDSGSIELTPEISDYDSIKMNGMKVRVSQADEFFLSVPPNVSSVRFQTDDNRLLVSGSVRPPGLVRTIRVPEDQHSFNRIQSVNRSWFALNPVDHLAMIRENRSFMISTQVKPPEIDQTMALGDYDWFRYTPNGRWIGRQMLIPQAVEDELEIREQAISASYFELKQNQTFNYSVFQTSFGPNQATPKLIYAADQGPGHVSVLVDGKVVKKTRLLSQRGEINLRDVEFPTTGRIEIRSENAVRLFLSQLDVHDAPHFLKRTAQRLDAGKLQFVFTKHTHEDELLTMRFYRTDSEFERCKVRVQITFPESTEKQVSKPQTSWTVTDRIYDLRPLEETPSVVLGSKNQVDAGHRCFIRLGAELPPGDYPINVERVDEGTDGLVLLYQTVVGKDGTRKIKIENSGFAKR